MIDEFPEWFDCMKVNCIDGTDMNKTVLQNKNSQPNYSVGMPNQPRDIPRNQDSNGHQILEAGRTQYTTIVNKSRDHNNTNMNIHEKGETTSLFSVESLLRDTDSVKESGSTNRHEQEKSVRIVTGPDTEQNNNSRPTVHTSSKNVESNLPRESENSSNIPVAQCELVNSQSNINTNTRIEALPPSFTTQSDRNRTKNKSQQNTLGMPSPRTNHALTDEGNPTVANRGRSFVRYTDSVQSRCRSHSLGRQYVNSVQNMADFMAANRNTTDASKNSKLNKDTRTDISTEKRNETYSFKQPQRDRLNDPDTVKKGGGERPLNFTVLNIQGLIGKRYDKLTSSELKTIFNNSDVILLTETWTNEQSKIELEGFTCFMLNRNKHQRARRDSGGLVIYIRNEFCDGNTLVKVNEGCIIWVKLYGELFHIDSDLYVCLCYNTPVGSSRANYSDRSVFDMILDDILYFEAHLNGNCHFIVCGDLNARTANLPDYVASDSLQLSDLLPEDYVIDSPLPRVSEDKVSNEYGNQLLEFCKATGLRLANGRLGEDKNIGRFTCIKGNGSSVVDYVL